MKVLAKYGLILLFLYPAASTLPGAPSDTSYSLKAQTVKAKKKPSAPQPKKGKPASSTPRQSGQQSASSAIRNQKAAAEKEIRLNQKKVADNDKNIRKYVNELNSLGADITITGKRVEALGASISALDREINGIEREINSREQQVITLKKKYITAIKRMRLKKGDRSAIAFIFASNSLNQALRRMRYLREFAQWRRNQVAQIRTELDTLDARRKELTDIKNDKRVALGEQRSARKLLIDQQTHKQSLVKKLKDDNASLRTHIARKQKEINDLNVRIAQAIEAERREEARRKEETRRKEEAKKQRAQNNSSSAGPSSTPKPASTSANTSVTHANNTSATDYASARQRRPKPQKEEMAAVSGFASARGRLPKPVGGSFKIIAPYGRQSRPGSEGVAYDNTGIDVETSRNAQAKAIYEGVVSGVYKADGFSHVVLVKHGNYYTVYANLNSVSVQPGQKISTGQTIGTIGTDGDRTILHFEIWKERTRMNPSDWIAH